MKLTFRQIELKKRYPLRISRGVSSGSVNLFVLVEEGGFRGIGEMAPGSLTGCESAEEGERVLREFAGRISGAVASVHEVHALGRAAGVAPCALAAVDMALWDLLARRCSVPLHTLLGLPRRSVPTSVTIGIEAPEVIRERVPEILARTGAHFLKVKLGAPEGIEADREHYVAALEAARATAGRRIGLRVDANGGWSLSDARTMLRWLAERDADYVEQPLHHDHLEELPALYKDRPLPIFLDESCRFSTDIPAWAHATDGINLKLMKCGGITEALRIVATARAFGLQTMIGCMGESSLAISAGASLGALFDHIDLDSHLNILNDPAEGAHMIDGIVTPPERPGHGARFLDEVDGA
jgi:muconate cycloisomerase